MVSSHVLRTLDWELLLVLLRDEIVVHLDIL
jgi:hypothetical protein